MATYDIDELLRKHDSIYCVGMEIWNAIGSDKSHWTVPERVIIGCTRFNIVIGNGFWDFLGCVHAKHFFECLEGLRAVRDNLSSRAAETFVSVLAEYGITYSDEATWDRVDDLDEESDAKLQARVREIDELAAEMCDGRGPDSLREALADYIHSHIHELRLRNN